MSTLLMSEPAIDIDNNAPAKRYLFTHWEGGGNTPPMLSLIKGLLARGHSVRVISDPCNRQEIEATGASFEPWRRGNPRLDKSIATDPLRDWEVSSPLAVIGRLRDRLFVGPAHHHAHDVLDELQAYPADVIVTSDMLLGVMAAAESAGIPCVGIAANICLYPLPGVPPFGPGFHPARGPFGRVRDALIRRLALREFGKGTAAFNAARAAIGLKPLSHPFQQLETLSRHLILTSAAFDFASTALPSRIVYTGPDLEDPAWTGEWQSPWSANAQRPLVLVGFSTTFQNQSAALRRVIEALAGLDVRAVVTVGPALDLASLPAAPNVHLCASAPHSQLLKDAALVISHAGHGTVIRSLAAGVPLVCMPMGRDQNDNAARVEARAAGLRLSPAAEVHAIRSAVRKVLSTPVYRDNARKLGARIVADAKSSQALEIVEETAVRNRKKC